MTARASICGGVLAATVLCASCGGDETPAGAAAGPGGTSQAGAAGSSSGGTSATDASAGAAGSGGSGGAGDDAGVGGRPCVAVPSGTPLAADPSYRPGSLDASRLTLNAVAVDRKGRLVVAGERHYDPYDIVIARFLPDGPPDPDFHGDGIVTLALRDPLAERALALAFDAQDRIWVGGSASAEQGGGVASPLLARLSEDGFLDPSFDPTGETPGVRIFRPRGEAGGGGDAGFRGAAVDSVLIAATGAWINGNLSGFFDRVLEDGSFDPSFSFGYALVGRLRVLGDTLFLLSSPSAPITAFDVNGRLRASFGSGGEVTGLDDYFDPTHIVAVSGARYLAVDGSSGTDLVRLTAGGAIDTSFGGASASGCIPHDVAIACDGRVLIVGIDLMTYPERHRYCAMVYAPDGSLPASPPPGNAFTWEPPLAITSTTWLRFDAAGRIVVAVKPSNSTMVLERYYPPWATP